MTETAVALTEAEIRADERRRVADRIDADADTFAAFAADKSSVAHLVALTIRLPE